jgi:hypothetical protein
LGYQGRYLLSFVLDTKESNKEKDQERKDIQHFSFFRHD